jgi:hypothetical protein
VSEVEEGWGVMRPGDRVYHYYRDGFSLCRKVGFYRGELAPDVNPNSKDCVICTRKLRGKTLKAVRIAPGHYEMNGYTLKRQTASDYDRDLYWAVAKTADLPDEPILGRIDPPTRLAFKSTLTAAKTWVLNQAAKG